MEITDDEIIIPAESAAHMWMDRFIKQYKYGIDENVIVEHGNIFWSEDYSKHSVCLNKDRFIIDGNEIFINSELWAKYVKMRELTGSVYIRAPKKIAFPDDWSEMSDEQVLENVQYLQKNYKKYKITAIDDKSVQIDNVNISRGHEEVISGHIINNGRTYFIINGKKYYRNDIIGKEIIDLMHLCKMQMIPFKEKAKKWFKQNRNLIIGSGIFIVGSNIAYFVGKDTVKKEIRQEITKDLLDSLRKDQQQKTINYNDTVKVR